MTHDDRVLALLSDGEPHSHQEIYGLFVVCHSRISSLRKKGHMISCWRDGDAYWYQLVELNDGTGATLSRSPSTEGLLTGPVAELADGTDVQDDGQLVLVA